jgi:hypothetical protein
MTDTAEPTSAFTPPRLFLEPEDGWLRWALREAQARGGEAIAEPGAETVSGRLIRMMAPAWAQGLALPAALEGTLSQQLLDGLPDDEATTALVAEVMDRNHPVEMLARLTAVAKDEEHGPIATDVVDRVRVAIHARLTHKVFTDGRPISLAPYQTQERYTFPAMLRRVEDGRYEVGGEVEFEAGSPSEALDKARRWFLSKRDEVIDAIKEQAKALAYRRSETNTDMYTDLLAAVLRADKELATDDGTVVAWQSGAHGMYGVESADWCYLMETTPAVAARVAAMAHRLTSEEAPPLALERMRGQVADLVGLDDWKATDDGYEWAEGRLEDGVVYVDDKPVVKLVMDEQRVRLLGGRNKVVVDSLGLPGLDQGDWVAWAVATIVGKLRARQRRQG